MPEYSWYHRIEGGGEAETLDDQTPRLWQVLLEEGVSRDLVACRRGDGDGGQVGGNGALRVVLRGQREEVAPDEELQAEFKKSSVTMFFLFVLISDISS